MRTPSLAEAVLTAVENLTGDLRFLYESESMQASETFQHAIKMLCELEIVAQRRVDDATYQQHLRAMHACHIQLPEQVRRG